MKIGEMVNSLNCTDHDMRCTFEEEVLSLLTESFRAAAEPAEAYEPKCKTNALLVFLKWFLLVRRRELPASEICSLTERGIELMEKLKEVFPEKSGEEQAWNFRKFHDILHT